MKHVVYTTHFSPKLGVIRRAIEFISDYTSLVVGAVDGIFKVALQARRNCVSIWTPALSLVWPAATCRILNLHLPMSQFFKGKFFFLYINVPLALSGDP